MEGLRRHRSLPLGHGICRLSTPSPPDVSAPRRTTGGCEFDSPASSATLSSPIFALRRFKTSGSPLLERSGREEPLICDLLHIDASIARYIYYWKTDGICRTRTGMVRSPVSAN